jgi:hypothetical protein
MNRQLRVALTTWGSGGIADKWPALALISRIGVRFPLAVVCERKSVG